MTTIQGMPNLGPGLRLHLNENTGGCSPKVLAAIHGVSMEDVASYADYEGAVRDTAAHLGVDPDWVVLTNGLDEGLLLAAIAYLMPKAPEALVAMGAPTLATNGLPEQILMLPTFEPYVINAVALGARTIAIPCGPDFEFPVDAVLAAITTNTRLIYVNTPHNPSGRPVGETVIRRVIERADHAVVLIDEAYHDFHGVNFLHLAREYPNVLVGRTFSKAYGLAGMRIGVLAAQPPLLDAIRFVMPLFNLNSVAVTAMRAALGDREFMPWYVAQARESKALLYAALDRLGLRHWKSEANFVLIDGGARAQELIAGMIAGGVLVRDRGKEHNCANCFRFTTGVVEHTKQGIARLEALCAKG